VPVELGVTHHTIVAELPLSDPANVSSPGLPMQKPEAPIKGARPPVALRGVSKVGPCTFHKFA
jgi:hypothetical protein